MEAYNPEIMDKKKYFSCSLRLGLHCIAYWDQNQYLGNCPPTPPLTRQQSIDNKLGLMLGQGRGRWAVAQILILICILISLRDNDSGKQLINSQIKRNGNCFNKINQLTVRTLRWRRNFAPYLKLQHCKKRSINNRFIFKPYNPS